MLQFYVSYLSAKGQTLKDRLGREDGVTAVEYALIAALIAVAIILAVTFLGGAIKDVFTTVGSKMSSTTSSANAG